MNLSVIDLSSDSDVIKGPYMTSVLIDPFCSSVMFKKSPGMISGRYLAKSPSKMEISLCQAAIMYSFVVSSKLNPVDWIFLISMTMLSEIVKVLFLPAA